MRPLLCLLVLFTLVVNHVAASIHIVKHLPADVSVGSFAAPSNYDFFAYQSAEHQHPHDLKAHVHEERAQNAHTEEAVTCVFYHVILATPGSLSSVAIISTQFVQDTTVTRFLVSQLHRSKISRISIRGPPESIRV